MLHELTHSFPTRRSSVRHYIVGKQGGPAVFLATGYGKGGEEAWKTFLSGNYHHPGDDMSQKIDWQAGARFAEANYRIARAMADSDTPPLWDKGDYFGNLFAPAAKKAGKEGKEASPDRHTRSDERRLGTECGRTVKTE